MKWVPRPLAGIWTPDQARVASRLPACRRLCVPAANGVGKTHLAADLIVSFMEDLPEARVIITAPTNRQVCDLLWPHVADRLVTERMADQDWTIPTQPKWEGGDGDELIGFATNTPERLQGYHAEHMLIVIDEASGMPASLITALEGIAVAPKNYIVAIGNPNTTACGFYGMTLLPSWQVETISALTHPNIVHHEERIPGATSWITLVDRLRDWCRPADASSPDAFRIAVSDFELQTGPDQQRTDRWFAPNDAFRVRYLGVFPSANEYTLINRDQIAAAQLRPLPEGGIKTAALDVARTGGDKTVFALREGDAVTVLRVIPAGPLADQAATVANLLRAYNPSMITVDAAGIGMGLVELLAPLADPTPVVAFNAAETPVSPLQAKKYLNRRAVAYANLQQAFEYNRISIPAEKELVEELSAIRYRFTDKGQMQMLKKDDIKRIIGRSPDYADALSLLWENGIYFSGEAVVSRQVARVEERW